MYKKKQTLEVHHFGCKLTSTSYLVTETTTWDVLNLGLVDLKEPWIELRRSWIKRVCFTNLTETQHFFPLWTEVTIHSIFAEPMILHPKKSKIFLHHSIIVTHLKMQFILITKLKLCKLVIQWLSSLQSVSEFSRSVRSNSLRPHGLQHTRPPCPSPTPRVYSNSCPLSRLCHPTISSSVIPFSSCLQSFPASGSFQMSQLFASGGQSIGVSASASVLPMNIQDWSPLGWIGWISLQSKGLSGVFSNTTVQKHQFFSAKFSF